ncbi:hypothetical protein SAMN05444920_126107 [Nonomuraea solani]|uniref:Uncharacterized protein n=1 Tax=Nonomuraea solani TaxID=1144553 RepID=A0A1H6EZZ3_9ACTN|nr:hypothetical protein SAMN05444920_126107 [Nonomuraea solani]
MAATVNTPAAAREPVDYIWEINAATPRRTTSWSSTRNTRIMPATLAVVR